MKPINFFFLFNTCLRTVNKDGFHLQLLKMINNKNSDLYFQCSSSKQTMAIYCPTILLISTMVSLTMSSITVDVITNYDVTRRNTYDVINNVTSQSGCTGRFESTKWTDGACRCYINHMFFVVEEKPGCFGSQQIDPSMF